MACSLGRRNCYLLRANFNKHLESEPPTQQSRWVCRPLCVEPDGVRAGKEGMWMWCAGCLQHTPGREGAGTHGTHGRVWWWQEGPRAHLAAAGVCAPHAAQGSGTCNSSGSSESHGRCDLHPREGLVGFVFRSCQPASPSRGVATAPWPLIAEAVTPGVPLHTHFKERPA